MDIPITQIASVVQDCDSIQMYGFLNFKNSEWGEIDTVHVYKLNVESGILSDHTSFVAPGEVLLHQNVISPSEFLASETNCDLLIDLDRNNSGLLFPYDFSPEDRLCFGNTAKIADEDTYIHTSYPLSHIDIFLKDVRDQGNEQLLFSGTPGINFTKISNGVYRLQGVNPNTPDSIYALALKNITYQNTAVPKTYGVRDIQIVGSNAAKTGDTIHSYITVGITISSDTFVCGKDVFLFEGKDYFAGDTIAKWLLADSGCDTLIEIYVKGHTVPIISITGDQLLCFDSAVTLICNDHWSYLWHQNDNYSATNEFNTNRDDEILLTATNEFGCKKDTSIFLQKGIDFTTTIPDLVNVEEGDTLWIDLGLQGDVLDDVIISPNSGLYYLEDRLLFNGFSSQEYALTLQGEGGCSLSKILFVDVVLKDLKSRIPNIVQSFSQLNNTVNFDLGDGVSILGCAIYDRWGNQVYSCSDSEKNAWNTTMQNQSAETGVYSYFLQYELKNGKTDFLFGDITVLK
ncbi:MAG: gliding motility-associated C-terminal domain-containing protein [Saprospiraceae bacterium]|nr:gliding motility-associated C-terminal domain-containing protein [Saprospiraceae bacterium]